MKESKERLVDLSLSLVSAGKQNQLDIECKDILEADTIWSWVFVRASLPNKHP